MTHDKACGIFVTGTDTGVGKTVVACALAAWCRRQGIDVGVMKPVATGGRFLVEEGRRRCVSDDARALARAARSHDPWSLINPVCLTEPLAPWTAALRARTTIRLEPILAAFRALASRHEFLIVEGVGGLLVPLSRHTSVADLIGQLGLPTLLVARPGLGTLNHTLLSLECLRHRRLPCLGILVNHAQPPPRDPMGRVAHQTNPMILRRLTGVAVTAALPHLAARALRRLTR